MSVLNEDVGQSADEKLAEMSESFVFILPLACILFDPTLVIHISVLVGNDHAIICLLSIDGGKLVPEPISLRLQRGDIQREDKLLEDHLSVVSKRGCCGSLA